jgi:hypothetical protein
VAIRELHDLLKSTKPSSKQEDSAGQKTDSLASEKEGRMIQPSLILDRKAELGTGIQPFLNLRGYFSILKKIP